MVEIDKIITIYNVSPTYVEISDVKTINGRQQLQASRPLTRNEAKKISDLYTEKTSQKAHLTTPNTLMWHTDSKMKGYKAIFWIPRHINKLKHSSCDHDLLVPWPSLVIKANYSRLSVFAVKGNKRPVKDTPLYHVPAWNISKVGNVCTGNCTIENNHDPKSAEDFWKRLWFESEFTDENNSPYHFDMIMFWKKLHNKKIFPSKILKDTHNLLGDII